MSADSNGHLTVLDCRMADGREAVISVADLGIRDRHLRGVVSNARGFRLSCDKAAMEDLGIDVLSVFE